MVGFALDIVTAGAAGTLRHFILEFATERLLEGATNLTLDLAKVENPWVRTLVGFGVNFVPRPKFRPRDIKSAELLEAEEMVEKARRSLDAPKTTRDVPPLTRDVPNDRPPIGARTGAGAPAPQSDAQGIISLAPAALDAKAKAKVLALYGEAGTAASCQPR